jgi:hypothetical protein
LRKTQAKTGLQGKLDGVVIKLQGGLQLFTREGLCHAVMQFIACNDQVSLAYVSTSTFLNVVLLGSRWLLQTRLHSGTAWLL